MTKKIYCQSLFPLVMLLTTLMIYRGHINWRPGYTSDHTQPSTVTNKHAPSQPGNVIYNSGHTGDALPL